MRRMEPDSIGDRYGRLTIRGAAPCNNLGGRRWICVCDCGKERVVLQDSLRTGRTKSCGCLQREVVSRLVKERCITHGQKGSPEYTAWVNMKNRCQNPNRPDYNRYGGRGIQVCAEWNDSFECFLECVGPRPSPVYSLDRIDNNGDYEPENVRWATPKQQHRNRCSNRLITAFGETKTVVEWAEIGGLRKSLIRDRLNRGWESERAISTPVRPWQHREENKVRTND
jgi:hypothetical protein